MGNWRFDVSNVDENRNGNGGICFTNTLISGL